MVTTRYSNQQGSKSQQDPYQVQPTKKIENLSASRVVFGYELQLLLLTVWSAAIIVFQNLNYKPEKKLSVVLPIQQSHQKWLRTFSSSRRVSYTKASYTTLFYKKWHRQMSKRLIKPNFSLSTATSIDSDCGRLLTTSVLSNRSDKSCPNQFWSTSPSFSRPHITSCRNKESWNTEV